MKKLEPLGLDDNNSKNINAKIKRTYQFRLRLFLGCLKLKFFGRHFLPAQKKKTFDKNIELIQNITGKTVDTSCVSPVKIKFFTKYKKLACKKNGDYIYLNVFFDASEDCKSQMQKVENVLNIINDLTLMNLPPVKVVFSPDKKEQHNPFCINLYRDNDAKKFANSEIYTYKKFAQAWQNCIDIKFCNAAIASKNFCGILTHELMHSIFGLIDVYDKSQQQKTIMYGEYHASNLKLPSLNDIFLINALCWKKQPTQDEQQEILEFYHNYESFCAKSVGNQTEICL